MPYTSRYDGPDATPEEADVAAALERYSTDGASSLDWVPAFVLYRVYCAWWGRNRWRHDPDAPARLTVRQFGRAVGRIFPGVVRRRRMFHGRNHQCGYAGLRGPDSIVSPPPLMKRPAHDEPVCGVGVV